MLPFFHCLPWSNSMQSWKECYLYFTPCIHGCGWDMTISTFHPFLTVPIQAAQNHDPRLWKPHQGSYEIPLLLPRTTLGIDKARGKTSTYRLVIVDAIYTCGLIYPKSLLCHPGIGKGPQNGHDYSVIENQTCKILAGLSLEHFSLPLLSIPSEGLSS